MVTTSVSLLNQLRSPSNGSAWSRFVELYTPLVFHWVGQLGLQGSDRADDVQDVFLVLLGKVSSFQYDPQRSFRAWLRTITLNKTRDFLRRAQRQPLQLAEDQVESQITRQIDQAEQDETHLLTETEYNRFLSQAALRLMRTQFSEQTWRACWEHVAEGRTAKEVAAELGMSENAVYLARGRVLRRLRDELHELID